MKVLRNLGSENHTTWSHIQELPLANLLFYVTDLIQLLLEAEIWSIIIKDGLRKGGLQTPIAQKTFLGRIFSGD